MIVSYTNYDSSSRASSLQHSRGPLTTGYSMDQLPRSARFCSVIWTTRRSRTHLLQRRSSTSTSAKNSSSCSTLASPALQSRIPLPPKALPTPLPCHLECCTICNARHCCRLTEPLVSTWRLPTFAMPTIWWIPSRTSWSRTSIFFHTCCTSLPSRTWRTWALGVGKLPCCEMLWTGGPQSFSLVTLLLWGIKIASDQRECIWVLQDITDKVHDKRGDITRWVQRGGEKKYKGRRENVRARNSPSGQNIQLHRHRWWYPTLRTCRRVGRAPCRHR